MSERVHAIDAVRGFCLLNIFINHITLGFLKETSVSKIGLSDTAEIFVFLSGVSGFLALGRLKASVLAGRAWQRSVMLYKVNILVMLSTLGSILIVDYLNGESDALYFSMIEAVKNEDFLDVIWSIILFQQNYGYSVVLGLYFYLMIWAPFAIWLSARCWWWALPPALLVWMTAGHFDLVARNALTEDLPALTPLPWMLIFTCGIAFGAAMAKGVRLPQSRLALSLALGYVIGYLVVITLVIRICPAVTAWFDTRNEHFCLGGSKSYQSPLRLLHALSVVYVFVACPKAPLVRLFYEIDPRNLLCRLGRASLPVFAFGAVAAVLINEAIHAATMGFGPRSLALPIVEVALSAIAVVVKILLADHRGPFSPYLWPWSRSARKRRIERLTAT